MTTFIKVQVPVVVCYLELHAGKLSL